MKKFIVFLVAATTVFGVNAQYKKDVFNHVALSPLVKQIELLPPELLIELNAELNVIIAKKGDAVQNSISPYNVLLEFKTNRVDNTDEEIKEEIEVHLKFQVINRITRTIESNYEAKLISCTNDDMTAVIDAVKQLNKKDAPLQNRIQEGRKRIYISYKENCMEFLNLVEMRRNENAPEIGLTAFANLPSEAECKEIVDQMKAESANFILEENAIKAFEQLSVLVYDGGDIDEARKLSRQIIKSEAGREMLSEFAKEYTEQNEYLELIKSTLNAVNGQENNFEQKEKDALSAIQCNEEELFHQLMRTFNEDRWLREIKDNAQ